MSKLIKPLTEEEIERFCFTPDGRPRREARELFRHNFLFFVYYVLGYKDLGSFHIKEAIPLFEYIVNKFPFTEEKDDKKSIIQPAYNRVLIELPRSSFKSTIFTVAACIWFIIRNPEIKIGLGSWKHDIAKGFLTEIKSHLEENDLLKRLYPEIFYDDPRKESPKWTDEMIRVIRLSKYKEHTIETFGIEKQPTSRHYDIIILDDVVNETNVTSNDIIQKTKDKFRLLTSLLVVPKNPIFVIGTRYHFNDLYSELEENEDWLVYKRPALIDGSPLFPERLGIEELEKVKKIQGLYIYSCQYLLTPMSPEDRTLNPSLLQTYKPDDLPEDLHIYGGMDIAFSTTKRSDRTAIIVLGYDPVETNIYILDGKAFRGEPADILDAIVEIGRKWHFKKFNIETIGMLGKILEKPIENKLKEARVVLNYELIRGYQRSYTGGNKNEKPRIPIVVTPHLETGRLFVPEKLITKGADGKRINIIAELKQEMAEYPFGKHDDIIDALALAIMSIPDFVPRKKKTQKNKIFDKYLKRYKNDKGDGYVYIRSE